MKVLVGSSLQNGIGKRYFSYPLFISAALPNASSRSWLTLLTGCSCAIFLTVSLSFHLSHHSAPFSCSHKRYFEGRRHTGRLPLPIPIHTPFYGLSPIFFNISVVNACHNGTHECIAKEREIACFCFNWYHVRYL